MSDEPLTKVVFLEAMQKNNTDLIENVQNFVRRDIDAALDKRELVHQETMKGILVIQERQNNLLNQTHERTGTLFNRTDDLKTNQDQQRGAFKTWAAVCITVSAIATVFAIMGVSSPQKDTNHHHDEPKTAPNRAE